MGLVAQALLTVTELKTLHRWAGDGYDSTLESAINAASRMISTFTGRDHLVTTNVDLTEYHTIPWTAWSTIGTFRSSLNLGEWPVISVTSVHEDTARIYGAASLLVLDTDYNLNKPTGQLVRVQSGAGAGRWTPGYRAVRVLYKAGYAQLDGLPSGAVAIPDDIKEAAAQMALVLFKQHDQQRVGVSSITDAASGSIQRFMGPMPPSVREMLQPYCRIEFSRTWERPA